MEYVASKTQRNLPGHCYCASFFMNFTFDGVFQHASKHCICKNFPKVSNSTILIWFILHLLEHMYFTKDFQSSTNCLWHLLYKYDVIIVGGQYNVLRDA